MKLTPIYSAKVVALTEQLNKFLDDRKSYLLGKYGHLPEKTLLKVLTNDTIIAQIHEQKVKIFSVSLPERYILEEE